MALELQLKASLQLPTRLHGILPRRLIGLSLAEIERLSVQYGNSSLALAELFTVSGNLTDEVIHLSGDLQQVDSLAAGLSGGKVVVDGSVGRFAGLQMRSGRLQIMGDAGDGLASAMQGGQVHVQGNAGNHVAAPMPGVNVGMTGGEVCIEGSAGHSAGRAMRRGLLAIGGSAGDFVGYKMLAGTILVGQTCGLRPGAEMRRGTLILLQPPASLLPTFTSGCCYRPTFLPMLGRRLSQLGYRGISSDSLQGDWLLYHGDQLELGRGELLVRA